MVMCVAMVMQVMEAHMLEEMERQKKEQEEEENKKKVILWGYSSYRTQVVKL